jgi:ATP-dependent protease HslVU (ClpYQ) peptidase subunit
MTTIAYRDGVMAADTQATWSDTVSRVHKLHRLPCGGVMAGCGTYPEVLRAVEWVKAGRKGKPPKVGTSWVLLALGNGEVYAVTDNKWTKQTFIGGLAMGTGMQPAQAAMNYYNATALEAVECAATVDPYTSGPFEQMAVEPKRAKSKRTR